MSIKTSYLLPDLDDIFIIWPHGKDAFSEFLNRFNTHEPPIKFKYSICIDSVNYFDTTVFKDPKKIIPYWLGETSTSIRLKANGHRFTFERKHRLSSLYTHLKDQADSSSLSDYNRPSVGDYSLILIEEIHSSGSDWQDRINRLKRETFWIDTPGSLEPTGLNKNRSEDILESAENSDTVALVMPFSRTGNMASRIINKHFKIHQPKSYLEHYQYIVSSLLTLNIKASRVI